MNIRNLGMKSVDEIRSKLIEYGYTLESEES
jgi:DNA-directed RNA polymerase subunit alpha